VYSPSYQRYDCCVALYVRRRCKVHSIWLLSDGMRLSLEFVPVLEVWCLFQCIGDEETGLLDVIEHLSTYVLSEVLGSWIWPTTCRLDQLSTAMFTYGRIVH